MTYTQQIAALARSAPAAAQVADYKRRHPGKRVRPSKLPPSVDMLAMPGMKEAHDALFAGELRIGRRFKVRVLSLADASMQYATRRDESGEGASTFPDGELRIGDRVYRVSYNGKVWANLQWQSGDVPAYDPFV